MVAARIRRDKLEATPGINLGRTVTRRSRAADGYVMALDQTRWSPTTSVNVSSPTRRGLRDLRTSRRGAARPRLRGAPTPVLVKLRPTSSRQLGHREACASAHAMRITSSTRRSRGPKAS
jgi:dihydroorotate dehydrogenase